MQRGGEGVDRKLSCLSAAKFVRQSAKVGLGRTRNGLAREVERNEEGSERGGGEEASGGAIYNLSMA